MKKKSVVKSKKSIKTTKTLSKKMGVISPRPALDSKTFDVIVVGGGPGGSSTAAFLSKAGAKVLLVDKATFPRDKICGDAISGKSIKVIRQLGLLEKLPHVRHGKVRGVLLSSPKGEVLDLPFASETGPVREAGYVIRRQDVDNLFFQNAKSQVAKTIEGFSVTDVVQENGTAVGIKGKLPTGEETEFRAKLIVGADGANSVVANKLGVKRHDDNHMCAAMRAYYTNVEGLTDRIEIHFIKECMPGYFWIFPIDGKNANVGIGMLNKDIKKNNVNLQKVMLDAIQNNELFKDRFKNAKLDGPIAGWRLPFGSKHQQVHGNGFVLVGDAASLIDPFSGEGVGNALTSGRIASDVIEKALRENKFDAAFLQEYETNLWKELDAELQTSYSMQRLGRNEFLLNMVIHKAATKPKVKDAIVGMLGNEESKKDLVTPMGLIKLMFF